MMRHYYVLLARENGVSSSAVVVKNLSSVAAFKDQDSLNNTVGKKNESAGVS